MNCGAEAYGNFYFRAAGGGAGGKACGICECEALHCITCGNGTDALTIALMMTRIDTIVNPIYNQNILRINYRIREEII